MQLSRAPLGDSIYTWFVRIGQEMDKWQPESYEKSERRKSLGPSPLSTNRISKLGLLSSCEKSEYLIKHSLFIDISHLTKNDCNNGYQIRVGALFLFFYLLKLPLIECHSLKAYCFVYIRDRVQFYLL